MPAPLLSPDTGLDPAWPEYADSVRAALLGGAIGEALGAGADGPSAELRIAGGTQLTLYTLDALQEVVEWANQGHAADETACLWLAYLRWLGTQGERHPAEAPRPLPRGIDELAVLHAVRDPDATALEALRSGRMGEVERPLLPEAKGAGPVLRSAPFGLLPHVGWRTLAPLAINGAALTHGHPEAQTAAAVHGFVVHAAVRARREGLPQPVAAAVAAARETAEHLTRPVAETLARLDDAVRAAGRDELDAESLRRLVGAGGSAPEVLAGGLGAALRAEAEASGAGDPQAVFRRAVELATAVPGGVGPAGAEPGTDRAAVEPVSVRTGAPVAAGAIAGAVTGAALGTAALPPEWRAGLDAVDAVSETAERWLREVGAPPAA